MAGSYNKVLLMGNLTRDIELKYVTGDNAVANIGIAVNRRFKSRDGEWRDETTFVDCEAWGRTAETMSKYLAKGRPVFIEGRLKLDQWQDNSGNNRSKLRVVVENFQFVDSPGSSGGGGGNKPQPAGAQAGGGGYDPVTEDDIPF
ncbi:MAG: single-stranded DNA-binding protein [Phycisphaerales bacterium JB043]